MEELQTVAIVVLGLAGVLLFRYLGTTINDRLQNRRRHVTQARRHFVRAAEILAQAQSIKLSASESSSLARSAITEADLAIELDPKDAASRIVKSVALEFLRKPEAALKALDSALSKECAKSLAKEERADILLKHAELILSTSSGRRIVRMQDALEDLQESITLKPSNAQAHFTLGLCCEKSGDEEDALVAYKQAVVLEPGYNDAIEAVERLSKSSESTSSGRR